MSQLDLTCTHCLECETTILHFDDADDIVISKCNTLRNNVVVSCLGGGMVFTYSAHDIAFRARISGGDTLNTNTPNNPPNHQHNMHMISFFFVLCWIITIMRGVCAI